MSKNLAGPLNMPIHSSSGSHSQLVSIMSSCSLVAFPLSVSLASLHPLCLCSSVPQTCNCARVLIVATLVLKAAELACVVSHPTRMDSKPCMRIILLQSVTQRHPTQMWSSCPQCYPGRMDSVPCFSYRSSGPHSTVSLVFQTGLVGHIHVGTTGYGGF